MGLQVLVILSAVCVLKVLLDSQTIDINKLSQYCIIITLTKTLRNLNVYQNCNFSLKRKLYLASVWGRSNWQLSVSAAIKWTCIRTASCYFADRCKINHLQFLSLSLSLSLSHFISLSPSPSLKHTHNINRQQVIFVFSFNPENWVNVIENTWKLIT